MFLVYLMALSLGFFNFTHAADDVLGQEGELLTKDEVAELMLRLSSSIAVPAPSAAAPIKASGPDWGSDLVSIQERLSRLENPEDLRAIFDLLSPYILFYTKGHQEIILPGLLSGLRFFEKSSVFQDLKECINDAFAERGGFSNKGMLGVLVAFGLMGLKFPRRAEQCKTFLQEKLVAVRGFIKSFGHGRLSSRIKADAGIEYNSLRAAEYNYKAIFQMIEILGGRVPLLRGDLNKVVRGLLYSKTSTGAASHEAPAPDDALAPVLKKRAVS